METKFILHGGVTSRDNPHNDSFFAELSKNLKDGDTILFVGFARESEEEQERVYQRDRKTILLHTDKNLIVEKAEIELFEEQLKHADVVFVTGGITGVLKERLLMFPYFAEHIKGKVYAGSSAGANVISTYHTSGFARGIQEGLGIVPLCIMVHYGNPEFNANRENETVFSGYLQDLELLLLPECEWVSKVYDL